MNPTQPTDPLLLPPGFKVLLMGAPGSGKTHSLRTLINLGLKVRAIFLERQSLNVLGDVLDKINWCYISPAQASMEKLMAQAKIVSQLKPEGLIKQSEDRTKYTGLYDVMNACNDFKCQRTGESFGDAAEWGTDTVLFLDGLSGLTQMAFQVVSGLRVTKSLPEYGQAQSLIQTFLEAINNTARCHFICTAHIYLEKDEIYGGQRILVSTAGNKLAPILPNTFSDFILAKYTAGKFTWATSDAQAMLKSINLPVGQSDLQPDFRLVLEGWKKKGGIVCP